MIAQAYTQPENRAEVLVVWTRCSGALIRGTRDLIEIATYRTQLGNGSSQCQELVLGQRRQ